MAKLPVVVIEDEENDDWMKKLKGYQQEVPIHEALAAEYAKKKAAKTPITITTKRKKDA